jgi:hypothetical protein
VGVDGISVKFLKLLLPFICCHVMHVFNHAITSSVFPSMWKLAIVRPVAKVGTPSGPSDFRPISVVSVLSKTFERILYMIRFSSMSTTTVCCQIFSLAPQLP